MDLIEADDDSEYTKVHSKYHPMFKQFLEEYGYYDIFLVDEAGNIVYTVYKEDDYGTNLINGKYADQNIADDFREANASGEQTEGIEQVSKAVQQMDEVTQQNAANAEETASASEEMSAQVLNMKKQISILAAQVGGSGVDVHVDTTCACQPSDRTHTTC